MMRAFGVVSGLCSAVAAAVLGTAASAHADQQIPQGIYTYQQDGLPPLEWQIYPICAQTVADLRVNLELPVGCTIHVAPNDQELLTGGDARLTNGIWEYTQPNPMGFECPDGRKMPLTETYKFDMNTMQGTRIVAHNTQCGVDAALTKTPFTLTFKQPLPIPVDQYPIYCSPYDALRRCS